MVSHRSKSSRSPYRFLVSACLAGVNCTYKGTNNKNPAIQKKFLSGNCLLVCPEVMGGLPTPREPIEISGGDGKDVLAKKARMLNISGLDVTAECLRGTSFVLRLAKRYGIEEAILKAGSPCCGKGLIHSGKFDGKMKRGNGLLTSALLKRGIKVYLENSRIGMVK